jgi:hypothetical protein
MPGVKKFCDIIFAHADASGSEAVLTAGVVLARFVPDVGDYAVYDLVPRPSSWGRLCQREQRPVYHKKEQTKCAPASRALVQSRRGNLKQPDPKRVSGTSV